MEHQRGNIDVGVCLATQDTRCPTSACAAPLQQLNYGLAGPFLPAGNFISVAPFEFQRFAGLWHTWRTNFALAIFGVFRRPLRRTQNGRFFDGLIGRQLPFLTRT